MLTETFNHTLNKYGRNIYINEETQAQKALLSKSSVQDNFADYTIHTNVPILRGDLITIKDEVFMVISDIQLKNHYEYKATIRPCDLTIDVVVTEEEIVDYDELGRPIYEETETTYNVPAYVDWQRFNIEGTQVRVSDNEVDIVVQDNEQTQTIQVNDEFDLLNKRYAIENINQFQSGLLILRGSKVTT